MRKDYIKMEVNYKSDLKSLLERVPEHSLRRVWIIALHELFTKPSLTWDKRNKDNIDQNLSPPEFIKRYYDWDVDNDRHRYGLSLEDVKAAQPNLYRAYKRWIKNHPEDDLHLQAKRPYPGIDDPVPN